MVRLETNVPVRNPGPHVGLAGLAEAVDNMVDQVIGEVPTSALVAHPCRVVAGAMMTAAGTTARVR
jgi:hypothetical protein